QGGSLCCVHPSRFCQEHCGPQHVVITGNLIFSKETSPVYATVNKPKNTKQDDSIHYADIQVFTKVRERSAEEVKNLQMQNATEYATLNFPRPRLKYDSKNGTLV
uniref:Uncharacterized protein n=1 Tax=Phasianus colchicus TaxID=9054 RepID=A0A669PZY9_PHACC